MGWKLKSLGQQGEHSKLLNCSRWKEEEEEEHPGLRAECGKTSVVLSFTCATFTLLVFALCLHDGHMDSVKKALPNRGRQFRTHRTSAQMSAMRMDRDRKSWHSWERSRTVRKSAGRAMIRGVKRGPHWSVIVLLSLALQPQVSRRSCAIFTPLWLFFHGCFLSRAF